VNPGTAFSISLALTPDEDTPFGEFTGTIYVESVNAYRPIGFRFAVVSDQTADLTIFVEVNQMPSMGI
jgi:hypothetical protein